MHARVSLAQIKIEGKKKWKCMIEEFLWGLLISKHQKPAIGKNKFRIEWFWHTDITYMPTNQFFNFGE